MLERSESVLKLLCLGLAVLMLYQFSRLAAAKDPLAHLTIPAGSSLPSGRDTLIRLQTTNPVLPQVAAIKETNIPPAVQAGIDRITQSEIFGLVPKPVSLPMALLGIAAKDAFLRAPNGQTGLLREGDELAGIKLLQIGTNRVLIEYEGQKKELTLFSGLGNPTLLLKEKENPQ